MQQPHTSSVGSTVKKMLHGEHLLIVLLMAGAVLIGALTVRDYGVSGDEADIYRYSDYALHAYSFILQPGHLPPFNTNLNLYGPAYYMAAELAAGVLKALIPAWSSSIAWHFVYFLTFLAGGLALYLLSKRWVSELSATCVTLLFLSQPLLWGHAFINPKDIPFMAFFTGAVYSGLRMTDSYKGSLRPDARLIFAAVLLGFTISFRVLGPLAGIIVLGYAVHETGWKSVGMAVPYLGLAAACTYLTWPYLWGAVVAHYLNSATTMAQFPYAGDILFGGQLYKATELPWTYFPTFVGIQLTEPALLLSGCGLAASALLLFKKRTAGPLALFLAWFLAPALLIIASGAPLYDNARQLYFLLPPLFIVAGTAFDRLFVLLTHPASKAAVVLVATLPGILLGIRLHPYEYVYYNILVGGTGGAYRKYEMDYWGISYKEITDYLNRTAPEGSNILVFGPEQIVAQYARPDLNVFIPADQPAAAYDYVAFLTRENLDQRRCKEAQTIEAVERRGAILSVLKSIPRDAVCR
jgi:hypothetical protein